MVRLQVAIPYGSRSFIRESEHPIIRATSFDIYPVARSRPSSGYESGSGDIWW